MCNGVAAKKNGYEGGELKLLLTTKTAKPDVQIERFLRYRATRRSSRRSPAASRKPPLRASTTRQRLAVPVVSVRGSVSSMAGCKGAVDVTDDGTVPINISESMASRRSRTGCSSPRVRERRYSSAF